MFTTSTTRRFTILTGLFFLVTTILCGAVGAQSPAATGFLTDYTRLKAGETSEDAEYSYVNRERLKQYNAFIVEPVLVHFYEKSKAHQKLTQEEIAIFMIYTHAQLVQGLTDGGYRVVAEPGPGVALLRLALTDIVTSKWYLNVLPQTRIMGAGLGGTAMEAELLDSQSGQQLAAVIDRRKGARVGGGSGMTKLDLARGVIRRWAEGLVTTLDLAHGR